MAEAPVTTKAPSTAGYENIQKGLPSSAPVGLGPAAATEGPAIDQMAKLNHQLATTLANDNQVLGQKLEAYKYNNSLLEGVNAAQPGAEARAFQAYENRDLTGNSGLATRGQRALAERFQGRKNLAYERLLEQGQGIARSAQTERGNVELAATLANENAVRRKQQEEQKRALEAPPPPTPAQAAAATPGMGGVQGYPKATAYVNAAFPGGLAEQQAWIKANKNKRAQGGPVQAGHPYLVGEEGKELFVPNKSGRIVPHKNIGVRRAAIERSIRGGKRR